MTLFSDKMLISHRCIRGLMPNLIKKSWTVSKVYGVMEYHKKSYGHLTSFDIKMIVKSYAIHFFSNPTGPFRDTRLVAKPIQPV